MWLGALSFAGDIADSFGLKVTLNQVRRLSRPLDILHPGVVAPSDNPSIYHIGRNTSLRRNPRVSAKKGTSSSHFVFPVYLTVDRLGLGVELAGYASFTVLISDTIREVDMPPTLGPSRAIWRDALTRRPAAKRVYNEARQSMTNSSRIRKWNNTSFLRS
ncbi:hypothetical protein CONLIGDRAFT_650743 [Coniochaeta ligniaria NRRL 30616]|uniref:Uncharacterized protein n=1 Tax=Coniochaeta ligniaria NRRL 30616 TaxID=1408157 RepID=A0A1J7IZ83_9PEZI|nr:hypothetical protein CONLIGDRAFT_650743 [Coniochaeta ligniaria NRRL 30616]